MAEISTEELEKLEKEYHSEENIVETKDFE